MDPYIEQQRFYEFQEEMLAVMDKHIDIKMEFTMAWMIDIPSEVIFATAEDKEGARGYINCIVDHAQEQLI